MDEEGRDGSFSLFFSFFMDLPGVRTTGDFTGLFRSGFLFVGLVRSSAALSFTAHMAQTYLLRHNYFISVVMEVVGGGDVDGL